jgi:hypothetical protein
MDGFEPPHRHFGSEVTEVYATRYELSWSVSGARYMKRGTGDIPSVGVSPTTVFTERRTERLSPPTQISCAGNGRNWLGISKSQDGLTTRSYTEVTNLYRHGTMEM